MVNLYFTIQRVLGTFLIYKQLVCHEAVIQTTHPEHATPPVLFPTPKFNYVAYSSLKNL